MDEIKRLLDEEIRNEIRELSSLKSGTKEKSAAIDDLAALYRLKIEESKNEMDFQTKCSLQDAEEKQQVRENALERVRIREQAKDRYFRLGTATAELILPLIFYAAWMKRGFQFEETGTFTSATFRGLFNRFRPTKK